MMFWYGHGVGGWGWWMMSVGMVLFWALIAIAAVLIFRALDRSRDSARAPAGPSAEQLLAERFARGEISEEEYRSRLVVLRSSRPSARS